MTTTRKVGTATLGLSLIVFGVLFLLRIFTNIVSYEMVLKLWPLILIFLGLEIIFYTFVKKDGSIIYDKAGIFLIMILSFFAMAMATAEFVITHTNAYYL